MLTFAPHPLLFQAAFLTDFGRPLAEIPVPADLVRLFEPGATVDDPTSGLKPMLPEEREVLRQDVRDLLRHGGHKPTGRGKPSSEYLVRAQAEGKIPSINLAVDACNAVSLHSGLPISVIDLDLAQPPLEVSIAGDESYVFNASGQEISLRGLLCLRDAAGPIANAVKDCHRTKTSPATTQTLTILWAPIAHAEHAEKAKTYYQALLTRTPGTTITPRT
ncbi:B3/4 domain protein [Planctomycetes bacterium Poly30]|uniref:B3/4 domain protein n=1 Tax=Saltatorellus ferox TaxID=2528018 RepID=A0A518ENN6_9BACT|nr:B3/4 domain protein [Planctomycetes bacterium Poly30]